jgi:hypothetical protein
MKKKIIKWSILLLVVVIMICTVRYLRGQLIFSWQVDKIEFQGFSCDCDSRETETVELSRDEIRETIRHYNASRNKRDVAGEGCESDFNFMIYMKDGSTIFIDEAGSPRLDVSPYLGEDYWVDNQALSDYAQELIKKYNLVVHE